MPVKLHMDEMAAGGRSFKWASDKTHLVEQVFLLLHRSALYRSVHRVAKHDQVEAFSFQHPDRQSGCVLWTEAPFASAQAHGLTADPGQARWIKSSTNQVIFSVRWMTHDPTFGCIKSATQTTSIPARP
jgi:hypothetical protein